MIKKLQQGGSFALPGSLVYTPSKPVLTNPAGYKKRQEKAIEQPKIDPTLFKGVKGYDNDVKQLYNRVNTAASALAGMTEAQINSPEGEALTRQITVTPQDILRIENAKEYGKEADDIIKDRKTGSDAMVDKHGNLYVEEGKGNIKTVSMNEYALNRGKYRQIQVSENMNLRRIHDAYSMNDVIPTEAAAMVSYNEVQNLIEKKAAHIGATTVGSTSSHPIDMQNVGNIRTLVTGKTTKETSDNVSQILQSANSVYNDLSKAQLSSLRMQALKDYEMGTMLLPKEIIDEYPLSVSGAEPKLSQDASAAEKLAYTKAIAIYNENKKPDNLGSNPTQAEILAYNKELSEYEAKNAAVFNRNFPLLIQAQMHAKVVNAFAPMTTVKTDTQWTKNQKKWETEGSAYDAYGNYNPDIKLTETQHAMAKPDMGLWNVTVGNANLGLVATKVGGIMLKGSKDKDIRVQPFSANTEVAAIIDKGSLQTLGGVPLPTTDGLALLESSDLFIGTFIVDASGGAAMKQTKVINDYIKNYKSLVAKGRTLTTNAEVASNNSEIAKAKKKFKTTMGTKTLQMQSMGMLSNIVLTDEYADKKAVANFASDDTLVEKVSAGNLAETIGDSDVIKTFEHNSLLPAILDDKLYKTGVVFKLAPEAMTAAGFAQKNRLKTQDVHAFDALIHEKTTVDLDNIDQLERYFGTKQAVNNFKNRD